MTHLQIERANMLIQKQLADEATRSHMASEEIERQRNFETMRHNVSSEGLGYAQLDETRRHNVQGEVISAGTLAETQRHNMQGEIISADTLAENTRHNVASEMISRSGQLEEQRHNRAVESETNRTNLANEEIKRQANEISSARSNWEKDIAEAKNYIARETNELKARELDQQLKKIDNDFKVSLRNLEQQWKIARMQNDTNVMNNITNAVTTLVNGSGKNIYYWVKALDDGTKVFVPRSLRRYN